MSEKDTKPIRLSKTKVLAWAQCPKRLYLATYQPELAQQDPELAYRFAIGQEVGRVARLLHSDGVLVGGEEMPPMELALQQTRELLAGHSKAPLFEATFEYENLLIRADIVIPVDTGLALREVKAAASLKAHHLTDCAVQSWVMSRAGYTPQRVEIGLVNSSFIYKKAGHYEGLLKYRDITDEVEALQQDVGNWVNGARQTLSGEMPEIAPGMQCTEPFACPFIDHCWQRTPKYPVTMLPGGGKVVNELLEQGINDIRDIAEGVLTKPLHQRVREACISNLVFVDPTAGKKLRALPYPRYYLDFESIQFAVPIWLDTSPYDQLPFQWSCHIEDIDGEMQHKAFLDTSGAAPMRAFTEQLIAALGKSGPIFVYSPFERRIINEQARRFPDLAPALGVLRDRLYDLQKTAKAHYYHPAMEGSWSIKNVLPTIAPELDYGELEEVQNGTGAQMAYVECIAVGTTEGRREELVDRLSRYCEMDTLAMVRIAHFFAEH